MDRAQTPLWVHLLVLAVVCVALYGNALGNEFVYDDQDQILRNPALRSGQAWTQFFTQDVWGFRQVSRAGPSNYYRPLQMLTYWLEYRLFGLDPQAFHAVNLGFHLLATLAAYALLAALLRNTAAAFFGALLFAAHPIHTEAVAWVSALPELLCALFMFLAVFFFIRYEQSGANRRLHQALALLATFLALLAKEMAFTLPLLFLLYLFVHRKARRSARYLLLTLAPYVVVFVLYFILRFNAIGSLVHAQHQIVLTPPEFVFSLVALVGKYFWKLSFPLQLNAFYVFEPTRSLLESNFLASLVALVVLMGGFLRWRRSSPSAAFLLAWMVLTLAPALYIGGVGENVFAERYLYIPSLGFCGLLGMSFMGAWQEHRVLPRRLAGVGLALLLGFYAWQSVRRNLDWRNNFVLYADTVKKSPQAALMHSALAEEYQNRGDDQVALAHYQQALRAREEVFYASTSTAYFSLLGIAALEAKQGRFPEAEKLITQALALAPGHPAAYNDYGRLLIQQGRGEEGIRYLEHAVQLGPDDEVYQFNLGVALLERGQYDRACQHLERSLEIYPQDPEAWRLLGVARLRRRLFAEAEAAFQQALNLNPNQKGVHRYLGALYYDTGRHGEAARAFQRALEVSPEDAESARWLRLAQEKIAQK